MDLRGDWSSVCPALLCNPRRSQVAPVLQIPAETGGYGKHKTCDFILARVGFLWCYLVALLEVLGGPYSVQKIVDIGVAPKTVALGKGVVAHADQIIGFQTNTFCPARKF